MDHITDLIDLCHNRTTLSQGSGGCQVEVRAGNAQFRIVRRPADDGQRVKRRVSLLRLAPAERFHQRGAVRCPEDSPAGESAAGIGCLPGIETGGGQSIPPVCAGYRPVRCRHRRPERGLHARHGRSTESSQKANAIGMLIRILIDSLHSYKDSKRFSKDIDSFLKHSNRFL